MGIKYSNQAWYYRVSLSLYLVAVIWVIGCIAPFLVSASALHPIGWWILGRGEYPGDFIMLCYYWKESKAYDAIHLFIAGYLALVLLVGFLADIPLANPLKVLRYGGIK